MQNRPEQQATEEAPLYIRWNAERVPYAVELRLELVAEISKEMARAEKSGIEVGGVLLGWLPSAASATLRIEELSIVPRGEEEGTSYVLDPGQRDRFAEIRSQARVRQRDAVGFFRSHLRPGEMNLSLADRSLLAGEFREAQYAVLLVEGREPHAATFFLAVNGRLPSERSMPVFRFDEKEFRGLPEAPPEPATPTAALQVPDAPARVERDKPRAGAKVYGMVAALLALAAAACLMMWSFYTQRPVSQFLETSSSLNLGILDRGELLRITWDNSPGKLDRGSGATVVFVDGASRREIQLGTDELRLGAIEYERSSPRVQVTMQVNGPGAETLNETVNWSQR